jgi:hypothetical protein
MEKIKMRFIRVSQKLEQVFAESHLNYELGILIHDLLERFLFTNLLKLFYLMQKIATRSKFTKLLGMKISAYFFPECWLVSYKLVNAMCEETCLAIPAKSLLCKAFTKF